MSILLTDITLTLNSKSLVSTEGYSLSDLDWVEFINASPFACHVVIGGSTVLMPAWYTYPIPLHDNRGNILPGLALPFTVTPYLQTIPGFNSVNILHTVLYARGEAPINTQPSPLGGYPTGMTSAGIASSVDNSGNPAGTLFIQSEITGDAQNPIAITNDAIVAIGDAAHPGSLSVVGPITATGNIQGDQTNNLVLNSHGPAKSIVFQANGVQECFVDSNGLTMNNDIHTGGHNISGGINVPDSEIKSTSGVSLFLDTSSGTDKINFKNNGTIMADISSAGLTLDSGTLAFLVGSISRVKFGSVSATNAGVSVTHGLGTTPDIVVLGVNNVSSAVTAVVNNVGATTFTVTSSANTGVYWLAIKA